MRNDHALAALLRQAPTGPWSLRAIHRAGGPHPITLSRVERGKVLYRTSIAKLASILGVDEQVVREVVEATARGGRNG